MKLLRNKIKIQNTKICYICKEKFQGKYVKDKNHCKARDHCNYAVEYRGAAHNIYNLKYRVPKDIPIVIHNGSYHDYYFIIKELEEEFQGKFNFSGKNT